VVHILSIMLMVGLKHVHEHHKEFIYKAITQHRGHFHSQNYLTTIQKGKIIIHDQVMKIKTNT
jgi:hypothetical protein